MNLSGPIPSEWLTLFLPRNVVSASGMFTAGSSNLLSRIRSGLHRMKASEQRTIESSAIPQWRAGGLVRTGDLLDAVRPWRTHINFDARATLRNGHRKTTNVTRTLCTRILIWSSMAHWTNASRNSWRNPSTSVISTNHRSAGRAGRCRDVRRTRRRDSPAARFSLAGLAMFAPSARESGKAPRQA